MVSYLPVQIIQLALTARPPALICHPPLRFSKPQICEPPSLFRSPCSLRLIVSATAAPPAPYLTRLLNGRPRRHLTTDYCLQHIVSGPI
ncbi:hypothetical protein BD310DRAFT_921373 [Dichomitus squalens]|uniref:Uncharacterized protein n=1 Tax=Dichomitus squalens TaxID=114155 RepID=A0A4V2K8R9_9APHY|nr:hypothetical protein BD310DRAFT_921373 [Dichomitus squalens]